MATESSGPASGDGAFDYQGLCARLDGRRELVDQLVGMALQEYGDQRERIARHVEDGDAAGLLEAAHRLKGQLLTLGVGAAAEAARRIEDCGRQGLPRQALPFLDELDDEMRRFEAAVVAQRTGGDPDGE